MGILFKRRSPKVDPRVEEERTFLLDRMAKPQRHRLLHGYPLAAAMPERDENSPGEVAFDLKTARGLLVGVLPHPFCNPAVTGCGFCTFAHEAYSSDKADEVTECVVREIRDRMNRQPDLSRRSVAGLYFGGGTANLTGPESFRKLCRELASAFDLSGAEVTLEGVPIYFVKRRPLLMDILRDELPARHFRVSMGVQSFDDRRLKQMGRHAFGYFETFREVVRMAHERGFTASGDLLFNLPHQTLDEMKADLDRAAEIRFDHLGLYHLVLFRGMGTTWASDPNLLAGLPSNEAAAENWVALREKLFQSGFNQTTLTNFERAEYRNYERRFVYEEYSFRPTRYEMLGFGPGGISFAANGRFKKGLKVVNHASSVAYMNAVGKGGPVGDRFFDYDPPDLRILYLTRRLSALEVDRLEYAGIFGRDAKLDFPHELDALEREGLLKVERETIRPTPRGMFYADAIAAQLARKGLGLRRRGSRWSLPVVGGIDASGKMNDNKGGHM
jgi:coproporphyrinogen III oxidase-like Fe-S oxidoreductase